MSEPEGVMTVGRGGEGPLAAPEAWLIEPRGAGFLARAREVWRYRHLLRYFAVTAIQRTYQGTLLGWLWLLIRPLFPPIIGTLVFHELVGVQAGEVPYFLFFMVGNAVWSLFEECLMWNTRSLQMNRRMLTRLYFPRIILPAATMAPALLNLLIHLGLIVAVSLYFYVTGGTFYLTVGLTSFLALGGVLLALVLALGIGFFTSVLGAETRDVRFTLRYILRFWFFLTPVIYPLSLVPEDQRWLAAINPMTLPIQLFKWGLIGASDELTLGHMGLTLLVIALTFAAGLWFFTRAEAASVDRL